MNEDTKKSTERKAMSNNRPNDFDHKKRHWELEKSQDGTDVICTRCKKVELEDRITEQEFLNRHSDILIADRNRRTIMSNQTIEQQLLDLKRPDVMSYGDTLEVYTEDIVRIVNEARIDENKMYVHAIETAGLHEPDAIGVKTFKNRIETLTPKENIK